MSAGVVEIFARTNPVLERLPFTTIGGSAYTYKIEDTLPGIAFRGVGESYTASTGIIAPQVERLTIAGGTSDFDRFTVKTQGGSRQEQDALKAKAFALSWLKNFFDGNSESDPREFDGLNVRLTGNQVLGTSGGATLTLDMVDELIDAVQGGPDVIFLNKTMRRKINKLVRAAGQSTEVVSDTFGRQLMAYAGIPLVAIVTDANGNEILAFDEDDGAGNADTASIYALKFGMDALHGIQNGGMEVEDLGRMDNGVTYRTLIEWYSGMCIKHPKSVARLRYVNNA
jgi:hypothetical protein